jgi:membrane associated rhomboid family serine protease
MDEAFLPPAPAGIPSGYRRGRAGPPVSCGVEELEQQVRRDVWQQITLAWTPRHPRPLPPIAIPELTAACRERQIAFAKRVLWTTAVPLPMVLVPAFFFDWHGMSVLSHMTAVVSLLLVVDVLISCLHDLHRARRWRPDHVAELAAEARYALHYSSARVAWSWIVPAALLLVWVLEIGTPGVPSYEAAALLKQGVREGELWRLLTAPFIHANTMHVLGNALVLGLCLWHVEVLSPKGTAPLVVAAGFLVGGVFSCLFLAVDSVGASGGGFAALGFIAAFGVLRRGSLPRSTVRAMLFAIGVQLAFGFLLSHVIDNAAHIGGLLAGALLGCLVARRPHRFSLSDRSLILAGRLSAVLLLAGFLLVFARHWYLAVSA